MVVIFAGNECTGKSTCFDYLRRSDLRKTMQFVKESYVPSTAERIDRVTKIKEFLRKDIDVVFDRATLIDDVIYSPIIDGERSILPNLEHYDLTVSKCVVIYLHCDMSILKARLSDRGDEYISEDKLQQISEKYEQYFKNYRCRLHHIDVSNLTPEEVAEVAKGIIEYEKGNENC